MKIIVRLYATLCRYIPGTVAGIPFDIELPDGSTVAYLIGKLEIPEGGVKVAFVNGRTQPPDRVLKQGDEVGIFPPVGGG
jgi:sulfur carrier protein ThiS